MTINEKQQQSTINLENIANESKAMATDSVRLLNKMKGLWPKYSDRSRISHLLAENHQDIFYFYLNTIFPFRKGGLKLSDPEAPTPVDFKLVYTYHYNLN